MKRISTNNRFSITVRDDLRRLSGFREGHPGTIVVCILADHATIHIHAHIQPHTHLRCHLASRKVLPSSQSTSTRDRFLPVPSPQDPRTNGAGPREVASRHPCPGGTHDPAGRGPYTLRRAPQLAGDVGQSQGPDTVLGTLPARPGLPAVKGKGKPGKKGSSKSTRSDLVLEVYLCGGSSPGDVMLFEVWEEESRQRLQPRLQVGSTVRIGKVLVVSHTDKTRWFTTSRSPMYLKAVRGN